MANVYATKTGNWSDTTVWNTSALPTSADDVYSNNYTVTIDQDVTVKSLRNGSATGITAGGGFVLSHTSGTTRNVSANVVGSTGVVVTISGTGTTNLTGSVTFNGGTAAINISGVATVSITGDLAFGSATSAYVVLINAACLLTVIGNLSGCPGGGSTIFCNVAGSTVTVTGAVTGGAGSGSSNAIVCYAVATLTVTGTITGAGSPAIGRSASGSMTWTLTGPFIAGSTGIAPYTPGDQTVVKLSAITANEFRFKSSGAGTASLWSSDVNSGAPSAANVRSGTKFGVSNEFTGTLAVPPTNSVASGVPVDNTTGTAALAPSDVAALVGAQIAAALDSAP